MRKVVQEADSGLWIAYQHPKPVVSYFSFQTRSFVHYELDNNTNYLFDIQRQGENKLWAISNEALYCMDVHTKKVEKMMPNDSTYLGLFTFCLDDSGNIWIGTIGNGLVKFDTSSLQFMNMKMYCSKIFIPFIRCAMMQEMYGWGQTTVCIVII